MKVFPPLVHSSTPNVKATRIGTHPLETLKSSKEFETVTKKGKSAQGRFVRLVVLRLLDPKLPSRIGLTISKKIHKHAVKRNRFRRQIKELFRKELAAAFSGFDIHVIARHGCVDISSAELRDDILRAHKHLPNR